MFENIKSAVSANKSDLGRKLAVVGGVVFGIAISTFLQNKKTEPETLIVVENVTVVPEPEAPAED